MVAMKKIRAGKDTTVPIHAYAGIISSGLARSKATSARTAHSFRSSSSGGTWTSGTRRFGNFGNFGKGRAGRATPAGRATGHFGASNSVSPVACVSRAGTAGTNPPRERASGRRRCQHDHTGHDLLRPVRFVEVLRTDGDEQETEPRQQRHDRREHLPPHTGDCVGPGRQRRQAPRVSSRFAAHRKDPSSAKRPSMPAPRGSHARGW